MALQDSATQPEAPEYFTLLQLIAYYIIFIKGYIVLSTRRSTQCIELLKLNKYKYRQLKLSETYRLKLNRWSESGRVIVIQFGKERRGCCFFQNPFINTLQ